MKHHCPMCGEQWDEDVCATCGWKEPQRVLGEVVDTVLRYRPTARSEPARQRKRRKTVLEKKRAQDKEK